MMKCIFLKYLLPLCLLFSTQVCFGEMDLTMEVSPDIIKNISLELGQLNAMTQNLEYMVSEVRDNQKFLEMEIENLKETSSTILNKLDQILGSTGSGRDLMKQNLE
ncbi:unnamed protein product, partial [Meganyctiphanes norvegica]